MVLGHLAIINKMSQPPVLPLPLHAAAFHTGELRGVHGIVYGVEGMEPKLMLLKATSSVTAYP